MGSVGQIRWFLRRFGWALALASGVALLALGSWMRTLYANPEIVVHHQGAPAVVENAPCDATLWSHVYHPSRLRIIESCKIVEGRVTSLAKEADGDFHIRLAVADTTLLNVRNLAGQHGDLVVEPVCMNEVTQQDAREACSSFVQNLLIPRVGQRVRVTGAYVTDLEHGWREIHPVTSIVVIED